MRSELTKMLFQKRTYIGWLALLAIPALTAVSLNFGDHGNDGDNGTWDVVFRLAHDNGLLLPIATVILASFFLPIVAAMAGGFQLAGEVESSTLRTWLAHPVNRGSVMLSKWFTAALYILAGLAIALLAGYAIGIPFFGAGRISLLSGETVSVARGLELTLLAYVYVGLSMVTVVAVAMLISTLANSSLTAAVGALVIVIVMQIVGQLSYFDSIWPYLFTSHFDAWQTFLQGTIDWRSVWQGVLAFAAYAGVSLVAAWRLFMRRDVLA
jgi:ABC-2 type transport system permease protein